MTFKINSLILSVLITNCLTVFCSNSTATSCSGLSTTQKSTTLGKPYEIPALPEQSNEYVAPQLSIGNLWGLLLPKCTPHETVQQTIYQKQVTSACTLASTKESTSPHLVTKLENFPAMLASVTNEKIQTLRKTTEQHEHKHITTLTDQKNELLPLLTAISWHLQAHKLQPSTREHLILNQDLFAQGIDACKKNTEQILEIITKEYQERLAALTKIQELLSKQR